ncbi:MAG TPA: ABC transporter substrate-binding protein [Burkholderiaceae bacterium]|nr:ABC transporter substrate-binding protein [Burkholderiaceae bacterium]
MKLLKTLVAAAALTLGTAAHADITVGAILSLTGPTSALGIPAQNELKLWPDTIAGQKLKVVILDDATDPSQGVKNARRLITEDKVDVLLGSVTTPVAAAIAGVATENQIVQLAISPVALPPGKDGWTFRMPQSTDVMSLPIIEHWKKTGVKTYGFLGYTDAYGEAWLKSIAPLAEKAGIKQVAVERFARSDTSVTGQALKIMAANPDAVLVVASGSGAAMPHRGLVERGYPQGKIYQTHGAATMDLIRVGGAAVEGSYVVSGPAVVADKLPASNASKKLGERYIAEYEKVYGKGSANQFAAHLFDTYIVLEKAIPIAMKKAQPGTPEFRSALKEALETMGRTPVSQGVLSWTAEDHFGFLPETGVLLKVVKGNWAVVSD